MVFIEAVVHCLPIIDATHLLGVRELPLDDEEIEFGLISID
jgi:hypothetical protein